MEMDVPDFAMIAGAGSGIGKACAATFARDGAAGIALLDASLEALEAFETEIDGEGYKPGGNPCKVITHKVDVSSQDQVNRAVQAVVTELGRIDYAVNVAGIAMKHEFGAAFAKTEDWQRIIDINLTGTFYVLGAATKIMLQQEPILCDCHLGGGKGVRVTSTDM